MNLITVTERFPTQESCIAHLEQIRFGDEPFCPLVWHSRGMRPQEGRGIKSGAGTAMLARPSFNVLSKYDVSGNTLALQQWFCAIALNVNATEKPVELSAWSVT